MLCLKNKQKENTYWLLFSLAVTYFWGLITHAYCFFDNNISHDSLAEFCGYLTNFYGIKGNNVKIAAGRFLTPPYRDVFRTDLTLPWLVGILGLLWIGLAVFLVLRIFRIESKTLAFLVAGVFVANITVSALAATYLHDFDSDMFSLFCATVAVYLWRFYPKGELLGSFMIAASLGFYQSSFFVAVTLIMIVCILNCLDGETVYSTLIKGLHAVIMLLLGGIFYFVALKLVTYLKDVVLFSGLDNSLDRALMLTPKTFVDYSIDAYRNCLARLWNAPSVYPRNVNKGATILLLGISGFSLVFGIIQKHVHLREKLLCIALALLLPYGMNLIYVLTLGKVHDLMVYSIWLFYLFALLLADWLAKAWKEKNFTQKFLTKAGSYAKVLCMVLVFLLLYGNVQFANGMYLKKDIQSDAYRSLMTRVVSRMEKQPEYIPGETSVVFVGLPEDLNDDIPGFEEYSAVTGMWSMDVLFDSQPQRFQAYFDYVLCAPIKLVNNEQWYAMREEPEIQAMPNYPAQGCMKVVDGVLVVKLGDIES